MLMENESEVTRREIVTTAMMKGVTNYMECMTNSIHDRDDRIKSLTEENGRSYVSYFSDLDKLIRDVKSVEIDGKGAIAYPIRETEQNMKEPSIRSFPSKVLLRLGDMLNIHDLPPIYFVPIIIPPINGSEYNAWKKKIDKNTSDQIGKLKAELG